MRDPGTITTPGETAWVQSVHLVPFGASLKVAIEAWRGTLGCLWLKLSDLGLSHQALGIAVWMPFVWETVIQIYILKHHQHPNLLPQT